ncbi:hypothetical protein KY358_06235 [Candidatus Woesearchaeota archaeon]|nr:hypothetical protein [Candidatus Woesearchaeota archaeon]
MDKKTKVLCENGFSFRELLGHLEEILKYKLLKKGIAPIHGSSFVYRDRGVNICAWINGGKTNSLLYFLERGASYISDEFTVLSKRGDLLAYPKRIDLRDFNVMALPTVAGNLSLGQRIRFRIVLTGKKFFRIFYLFGLDSISKIGKNIEFKVRMPLKKLFPGLKIVKKQRVDTLFLLLESNSVRAKIRPLPLDDFIDRVMATNIFEASKMVNDCRAYSFITGNRLSFARLHEKEREILSIALRPVKIYEVLVPKNFKDAMQEIEKLI